MPILNMKSYETLLSRGSTLLITPKASTIPVNIYTYLKKGILVGRKTKDRRTRGSSFELYCFRGRFLTCHLPFAQVLAQDRNGPKTKTPSQVKIAIKLRTVINHIVSLKYTGNTLWPVLLK